MHLELIKYDSERGIRHSKCNTLTWHFTLIIRLTQKLS